MTPTMECPEARVSLGVYVLGAIDPAERALVEAHLATCRDCRDELAGLAALPALLARVTTEEAIALAASDGPPPAGQAGGREAPPELLATVIDLTAARRRRRRWRDASLGVAAALIVAVGLFAGLHVGASPGSSSAASGVNYTGQANGPWRTATTSAGGMSASVSYRSMGWGTQLAVKVSGIPVGTSCQLWVIGPGGRRTPAGGWVTDEHEGAVFYPGSAGMPAGGVQGFQVTVAGAPTLSLSA
ncbi:MAG TPA: zf-HC2 domain-containing protein [Trebonia sp.]